MVRVSLASAMLCLALPWAGMAQEAAAPPTVTTEGPALPAPPEAPSLPALPTVSAAPVPPVDGAAEVPGEEDILSSADRQPPVPEVATALPVYNDLWGLVIKAHWVVQAVMAALVLAIAAVLAVFLFKTVEFALAFRRLRQTRARLLAEPGLVSLSGTCPLARTAQAMRDEAAQLPPVLTPDLRAAARERLEMRLDRIEAGVVRRLRSGAGLLASIGSVGPFVGLFGTVFGIMNSFVAIAATNTTSLSVVAPGIAEALLATGIGLVAAIPAVLLYNAILRRIASFRHALADARTDLLLRFSRDLDNRMAAGA